MSLPVIILILMLLGLVVIVVAAPLRERQRNSSGAANGEPSLEQSMSSPSNARADDLEAAREAKYREIRDSELDFRTGKLSAEDFAAIDAQLRAEALAILDQLERLKPRDA